MSARTSNQEARLATVLDRLRSQGFEPGSVAGWDAEEVDRNYGITFRLGTTIGNLYPAGTK